MLAAGSAMAGDGAAPQPKRAAPPKIAPVTIDDVEFATIPFGKARGLGQNGGYVAARDPATGKELWTLKVYDVNYDPKLEGDVQDVFITGLAKSGSGHELIVTDERGRRYVVDPKTRSVRPQ
jgi:outer membrane protein assembly factor BamB